MKNFFKKLWFNILNILTFGHLKRKAKAIATNTTNSNQLKLNTVSMPDVDDLMFCLGGKTNLLEIANTISSITFLVKNESLVDFNKLKNFSKKGVMKNGAKITLVVGDCANALKDKINKILN